jgi:hypothetical protein
VTGTYFGRSATAAHRHPDDAALIQRLRYRYLMRTLVYQATSSSEGKMVADAVQVELVPPQIRKCRVILKMQGPTLPSQNISPIVLMALLLADSEPANQPHLANWRQLLSYPARAGTLPENSAASIETCWRPLI